VKILCICHRIPYPPDKGDKIRSFNQVRALSKNHRVHLAFLIDDPADRVHLPAVQGLGATVDWAYRDPYASAARAALALPSRTPLSVAAFHSPALHRKIANRIREERPDAALVFSTAMAPYVWGERGMAKVLDLVDADSAKWRSYADYHAPPMSWIYREEARRLARYEIAAVEDFDEAVVVSEAEAEILRSGGSRRKITVIPGGVDVDYFQPEPNAPETGAEPAMVFCGAMDYLPNIDAVLAFSSEVFPLIRSQEPASTFYIVGRNPTPAVRRLADVPGVVVTGSVPDTRPYLRRSRVAVAPLRIARGIQYKVLEAMAMGLPVVGTRAAFQGIGATPEDGIRIGDSPREAAEAVLEFLRSPDARGRSSVGVREFVMRRHRWEGHYAMLEALLQGACARRAGAPLGIAP